ncbi:MAG: pyrimidine-nucleoside phosphorylase [Clostridia bacterium]|nr:pyrimidine-nucleoside phosphorylase [Clostridia bacterium]
MRIYDIISHKRDGHELTDEEIRFFIDGYVKGEIKDYHASALLMAVYLNGMSDREMVTLTLEMAKSGDMLDLSMIDGITVDKHSTGGVGDKTTLIVTPVVASLGAKVAKMSGRGLGHTGGTVDKLESIDGFNVELSPDEFISTVKRTGICVVGQTGNLAPADKKLYALRDATATVGCMPLIASSIMSKKLAAGSQCIVLDVKYGSGAFMKTKADAEELSAKMVEIGKMAGRKMAAVISDMDTPLGKNIGNTLEITEAVETLRGQGSADLREVSLTLAANLISLARDIEYSEARQLCENVLDDGSAYKKFMEFISAQGGNAEMVADIRKLPVAKIIHRVIAPKSGYLSNTDAEKIGSASVILGAGRVNKEDSIDYTAGIILRKKKGDKITAGDVIAEFHTNDEKRITDAENVFFEAITFSEKLPEKTELIYKVIR